jgi:pyocin large subunit-like protein
MPLLTQGFESVEQLKLHFRKHGDDFRASNANDYEQMADGFLGADKQEGVHECVRPCGAKLRYDPSSEAYGVLDAQDIIRTYFKPIPCSQIPFHEREGARQSGRCHTFANNLSYFKSECKK